MFGLRRGAGEDEALLIMKGKEEESENVTTMVTSFYL